MSFWWSLALLALPLATAVGTPDHRMLEAWRRGDVDEVERLGQIVSARGLAAALAGSDRERAQAAIIAAPAADDAWELLLPLAELADGPDRPLAAAAAVSAMTIAEMIDRDFVLHIDLPADSLRARLVAWRRLGKAADRWPDVRVHALVVATHLAAALGPDATGADRPYELRAMLADDEPEVRRAAAELVPQPIPEEALAPLAAVVQSDDDVVVAAAAAQALCGGLAFDDPAEPVLEALGYAGLQQLQELMSEEEAPAVARLDGARCLIAAGTDDGAAAVRGLARSAPAELRGQVSALLKKR